MEHRVDRVILFGDRLRQLRESAGLTQEELASRAGLTAKGISALERGERKRPYPHTVRSLADALDLSGEERASFVNSAPSRSASEVPAMPAEPVLAALPVPPTPLVGRERETAEITRILSERQARLLTLTGAGGIGKTRVAVEAARRAASSYPDGVAFVALAPLGDAALVVPTVLRALGLRDSGSGSQLDIVCEHLGGRDLLLVLDNFEHVAEAAPEVADLVGACPYLTVLVTSRAPLRLRGEREYPVPPLALPDPTQSPVAAEVVASPAVELFSQRAREASPLFEVTRQNAAAVAAVCWRLDGMPLALELAAARVRFLGPSALLSRLDRALEAGGARDLPERQRTMRATLDWSYDLLFEEEKALFRRLSVFAGGWTLEAAEAVGVAGPGEGEEDDVVLLLGRLVEQSLVETYAGTSGEEVRYRMLEPVRQYAREKLEASGEAEETRRRHAEYYLSLTGEAGGSLKVAITPEWLSRLDTEYDNAREAIVRALRLGDGTTVTDFAWYMWRFWWLRAHMREGYHWTKTALEDAPPASPHDRARLLFVLSTVAQGMGIVEPAWKWSVESLGIFRALGDKEGISQATGTHGLIEMARGNPDEAEKLFEECIEVGLEIGNQWGAAAIMGFWAMVPLRQGNLARARELATNSLKLARDIDAKDASFVALSTLTTVARADGDLEEVATLSEEGLRLSAEVGDRTNLAYCLEGLAEYAAATGNLARAARLWGASEAILEETEIIVYPNTPDRSYYEARVAAARERADATEWHEAWSEGRAMSPERAVAYALEDEL
jgi:predicted ATPase/DNA-binding XRE family transcriptional regulator